MPSQVLTKRRVKRRQQRLRVVSKNAKRKVRSVRKHRKTAKKVMKGGMTSAQMDDFIDDLGGNDDDGPRYRSVSVPAYKSGTAYVLYDKIPTTIKEIDRYNRTTNISKNVPTCVVFIVGNKIVKDDVYLFFNNRMSVDEITTTVKLLLGMSMQDTFELTPPIVLPAEPLQESTNLGALWNATANIFVKISGCKLNTAYCVFSGILDSPDTFDKVKTNEHKITTTNRKYNKLNGKEIKAYLEDESENGFKNRLSSAVLPELYKKYFVAANPKYTADVSEEAVKLFGEDIEWTDAKVKEEGKSPPIRKWNTTYPKFKELWMKEIAEKLLDAKTHTTYGLDAAKIEQLTKNRPLEITKPTTISYLEFKDIFKEINTIVDYQFTADVENWWESKEANELERMVYDVQRDKKERVDWCAYDKRSRQCIGENAW
jgi:hypothetical protein